jgi:hypothetical protein
MGKRIGKRLALATGRRRELWTYVLPANLPLQVHAIPLRNEVVDVLAEGATGGGALEGVGIGGVLAKDLSVLGDLRTIRRVL